LPDEPLPSSSEPIRPSRSLEKVREDWLLIEMTSECRGLDVAEYSEPGLARVADCPPSERLDLASSGLYCTIMTISWERCDCSVVFQARKAASSGKSSRRPGKGRPARIFFKHPYKEGIRGFIRINSNEIPSDRVMRPKTSGMSTTSELRRLLAYLLSALATDSLNLLIHFVIRFVEQPPYRLDKRHIVNAER